MFEKYLTHLIASCGLELKFECRNRVCLSWRATESSVPHQRCLNMRFEWKEDKKRLSRGCGRTCVPEEIVWVMMSWSPSKVRRRILYWIGKCFSLFFSRGARGNLEVRRKVEADPRWSDALVIGWRFPMCFSLPAGLAVNQWKKRQIKKGNQRKMSHRLVGEEGSVKYVMTQIFQRRDRKNTLKCVYVRACVHVCVCLQNSCLLWRF